MSSPQCAHTLDFSTPALPSATAPWREWVRYGYAWSHRPVAGLNGCAGPSDGRPARSVRDHRLTLHFYREASPSGRWKDLFRTTWPAYRSWYTAHDLGERPTLTEARSALEAHMPELLPHWERLVDLTGADPLASRMLTMWRTPAVGAGCSQVVVPGSTPLLVRNYDYDPQLFESVVVSTNYSGQRRVIGTSDMLWGLVDGMNEDGLAVSLTLGGRPGSGEGFAIPIIVRYLLETCADVVAALAALRRIPVAQAYNLSLVDTTGAHAAVYVAPGEAAEISDLRAVTNHRLTEVEYPHISDPLHSRQRQDTLFDALSHHESAGTTAELVDAFTTPPLRTGDYDQGFGTLYTAAYRPAAGTVTYHWPGRQWTRHFDDEDAHIDVTLSPSVNRD